MKEVCYYVADDGKKFDDRWDCLAYERQSLLNEWKDDFVFLNCHKEVIPIEEADTNRVFYIIVKNHRCASTIGSWFEDDGCLDPFYGVYDKTVEGTWVYGDVLNKGSDEWLKLELEIEKLQTLHKELNQAK